MRGHREAGSGNSSSQEQERAAHQAKGAPAAIECSSAGEKVSTARPCGDAAVGGPQSTPRRPRPIRSAKDVSVHSTRCVPPGETTSTRAAPPNAAAATAAAHAPVPDDSVGPTPRSQIRMRTRSGGSTRPVRRSCPPGKNGCTARAAAIVVQPVGRHRAEDDTLRVADPQDHGRDRLAADVESVPRADRSAGPCPRERYVAAVDAASSSRCFGPARSRSPRVARRASSRVSASQAATHRTPLPETSERLPSALKQPVRAPGRSPRRPSGRRRQCPDADRTRAAQGPADRMAASSVRRREQEVVAVGVRLDELMGRTRHRACRSERKAADDFRRTRAGASRNAGPRPAEAR